MLLSLRGGQHLRIIGKSPIEIASSKRSWNLPPTQSNHPTQLGKFINHQKYLRHAIWRKFALLVKDFFSQGEKLSAAPPGDVDLLCRMFVPSSPLRGCKNPINIGGGVACVTNYDHGGPLIKQPITPPPTLGKKLKVRELQPWHFWRVMEFGNANNITFP